MRKRGRIIRRGKLEKKRIRNKKQQDKKKEEEEGWNDFDNDNDTLIIK